MSRFHRWVFAPIFWWARDEELRPVLEQGRWERAKANTAAAAKDGRYFGAVATVVTLVAPAVVGFASARLSPALQVFLIVLAGTIGYLAVPFVWGLAEYLVVVPRQQTTEARQAVVQAGTKAVNDLADGERSHKRMVDALNERLASEREAWEGVNEDRERIRGLLGEANQRTQEVGQELADEQRTRRRLEDDLDVLKGQADEAHRREDAGANLSMFIWDGAVLLSEPDLSRLQVSRWGSEVALFLRYAFGEVESTKFVGPGQPIPQDDPREGLRVLMGRLRDVLDRFNSLALRGTYSADGWTETILELRRSYAARGES
jgi:hypothetical protein